MRLVAAIPLALVSACTASHGSAPVGQTTCDPLAPKAITLGIVVGVGKDPAGTTYVDAAHGVFVTSDTGQLIRQHVLGSGESGSNEFAFTFASPSADVTSARNLLVDTDGSAATAMALGPSDSKAFLSQSPTGTTPLTLASSSSVSGLPVVNTPNLISYIGDVASGDVILATVPLNDDETSPNGGLAIFYGPPGAMAQRPITNFQESKSGDGVVTFTVDGTSYALAFGEVAGPDAGPFGMFALLGLTPQGASTLDVMLRSPTPSTPPSGLSFTCLP